MVALIFGVFIGASTYKDGIICQVFAGDDKKPQDQKPQDQGKPDRFPDLNPKDKALFEAVFKKDLAAVQAAVDDGADVNAKARGGNTALIFAIKGSPDIAKYLLEKKADPNVINDNGVTALSIAKKNNLEDMVKLLTDAGATK